MHYEKLTLGFLRELTKNLPDDTLLGYMHAYDVGFGYDRAFTPIPYDDGDYVGDAHLFQVKQEDGNSILILGYDS